VVVGGWFGCNALEFGQRGSKFTLLFIRSFLVMVVIAVKEVESVSQSRAVDLGRLGRVWQPGLDYHGETTPTK
jgi:hypothetical protein